MTTETEAVETTPQIPSSPPKSYLVADCGTIHTTVALFDAAAGSYRLIATATVLTTAVAPWNDVHLGIRQATQQIAEITGRQLVNTRGDLIRPARASGTGVDVFIAVFSAAPALRTVIAGLFDKVSLASAQRLINSSYAIPLDAISLADTRSQSEQIQSIIHHQPDVILVVGGTDNGAVQQPLNLLETVRISALALNETVKSHVLFAGNNALRQQAIAILGENISLHMANNVRPSLKSENLHDASRVLNELYEAIKIKSLPGIKETTEWTNFPLRPTAPALKLIAEYLAELQKGRVLLVDVGGSSVTIADAAPDGNGCLYVRNDLGMGEPLGHLLDKIPLANVARWLPDAVDEAELANFIHNKALYPQSIPAEESELRMEQAVVRELLRLTMTENRAGFDNGPTPLRLLVARGGAFSNFTRYNQVLLTLLDALPLSGIFATAVDTYGILPALGVLAAQEPLAAVQAFEGSMLTNLGWIVVPSGKGQPGQKVLHVILEPSETQRIEIEVAYGTIETLPLAVGESAKVTLQPERRFDVGYGPGKQQTITIRGGVVGLVIDARGRRPLSLPDSDEARQTLLRQWIRDIGG
ncbi:MAG: glutamate mutase L [Anaerolineae bacterium]